MLLLTRNIGESVVIDGHIDVKIVRLRGYGQKAQIVLGITAPNDVSIHREEVQERINQERMSKK